MTSKEIEIQFKKELAELLRKYNAEIELEEGDSHDFCRGEDRLMVYIPARFEDGEIVDELVDIDLGRSFYGADG